LSFFARNEVFIYGFDRQVNGNCRHTSMNISNERLVPKAAVSGSIKSARFNKADVSRRSLAGHIWRMIAVANTKNNAIYNPYNP
jgi:hypothetical protein